MEAELPPSGLYPITDGNEEMLLDTGHRKSRRRYAAEFAGRQAELRKSLRRQGIGLIPLAAGAPLAEELRSVLGSAGGKGIPRHRPAAKQVD